MRTTQLTGLTRKIKETEGYKNYDREGYIWSAISSDMDDTFKEMVNESGIEFDFSNDEDNLQYVELQVNIERELLGLNELQAENDKLKAELEEWKSLGRDGLRAYKHLAGDDDYGVGDEMEATERVIESCY